MKNKQQVKAKVRARIKYRIRNKISGTPERPRLVVFRSNKNMTAQLVDDVNHRTLATVTSISKKYSEYKQSQSGKADLSVQIGQDTAELAVKMKITSVVFDRNGYKYHGRVKGVAEGARKGGLHF